MWKGIAMNDRPLFPFLVVTDLLLHSVDEFQLIVLFHGISKREAFICAYVGMVEQVIFARYFPKLAKLKQKLLNHENYELIFIY